MPPTPPTTPTPPTPPTPDAPPAGDGKPARPLKKWLIRGSAIAVAVLVLLLIITPTLISMGLATSVVASAGSDAIPGNIDVDHISVGWFSGAKVEGLVITDPNGNAVISFDSFAAPNAALLHLARGSKDLGEISLTGLRINVEQYEDGTTNLDKTFGVGCASDAAPKPEPESKSQASGEPATIPESLYASVNLSDALITVKTPNTEPITIQLAANAQIDGRKQIVAALNTVITQGVQAGQINLNLNVTDYADANGAPAPMTANVDLDAGIDELDLAVIDRLIGQEGLLVELIGTKLNASVKATGTVSKIDSDVNVSSKNFNVSGGIVFKDNALAEKPDTEIRFRLTPQAMAKLMASKPDDDGDRDRDRVDANANPGDTTPPLQLLKPVDLRIGLNNIHLATDENHCPQFGSAQVDLVIQSTDIDLQPVGDNMPSHLKSLKATLKSSSLAEGLNIDASFVIERDNRASNMTFNAKLNHLVDDAQTLQPMKATADIGFAIHDLDLATIEHLTSQIDAIVPILGPQLNASGSLSITPLSQGAQNATDDARTITGQLSLTTDQMQIAGQIDGSIDSTALRFGSGTTLSLTVQPGLLDAVMPPPPTHTTPTQISTTPPATANDNANDNDDAQASAQQNNTTPPGILEPLVLTFAVQDVNVPLDSGSGENGGDLYAIANLNCNDILLKGDGLEGVAIRDLAFVIDRFTLANESNISLNADLYQGEEKANLSGIIKLANLAGGDEPLISHVDLTISEIPVKIIDTLASQDGKLVAMLSDKIDSTRITLDATIDGDDVNVQFTTLVNSPNFNVDLSGELNPAKRLTLKPNSTIRLKIVPQFVRLLTATPAVAADEEAGTEAVAAKPGLELLQTAQAVITIKSLDVGMTQDPQTGNAKPDPTQITSQINFSLDDVDITEPSSQQQFNIRDLNFDVIANDLTRNIEIIGKADLNHVTAQAGQTGTLRTHTTAKKLFDTNFQLQLDKTVIESNTELNLPVGIIDALLVQEQRLVAALGDTIVGNIHATLNPTQPDEILVDIHTPTDVKLAFNASRTSDDEPFTWQLECNAAPVISSMKAIGDFDMTANVLNIERFQIITLYTQRQDLGILKILTTDQIKLLRDHRVALGAKIQMKNISIPLDNPTASSARIRLTIDSANAYYNDQRIPVGSSYIDISVANNIFTLNRANLKVIGGNVSLSGKTDLSDPNLRSKYTVNMRNLNIRSAMALVTEPKSLESRVAGVIDGEVKIQAPLTKITEAAKGGGYLKIKNGILTPLPVVSNVMKFLKLTDKLSGLGVNLNDQSAIPAKGTDAALVKFDFLGDRVKFTSIDLETAVANVRGSGDDVVTFDQFVDMKLKVELIGGWLGSQIDVPGFVKKAIAKKLTVYGPMDSLTIK